MKRVVAVVLACLLASPAWAQAPSSIPTGRVRITGVSNYEVPGVLKFEASQVIGKPIRITDRFVQFRRAEGGQLLTVLRPRQRLTGRAKPSAGGLLEFIPDGGAETLYVPLDAIAKTEPPFTMSTGKKVAIGVAIFVVIGLPCAIRMRF
jgi:hypothetical protein